MGLLYACDYPFLLTKNMYLIVAISVSCKLHTCGCTSQKLCLCLLFVAPARLWSGPLRAYCTLLSAARHSPVAWKPSSSSSWGHAWLGGGSGTAPLETALQYPPSSGRLWSWSEEAKAYHPCPQLVSGDVTVAPGRGGLKPLALGSCRLMRTHPLQRLLSGTSHPQFCL